MKLVCFLKSKKSAPKPIVLCESENIEDLKVKAVEYANSNPSFRHSWKSAQGSSGEELAIDFDYCLEIRP